MTEYAVTVSVCGGSQAEADGLAVQQSAVTSGGFDGVTQSVTKIEQRPRADGFVLIGFDDYGLDGDVAADERDDVTFSFGNAFDGLEHGGIADAGVLDDFSEAFVPFACRE